MRKTTKIFGVLLIGFLFSLSVTAGESIEEKLQSMAEENAKLYATPLVTAFGSGLNSGWFHTAKPHKLLGFDIGLKAMWVSVADDETTFEFAVPDFEQEILIPGVGTKNIVISGKDLYPEREVPTFFGESEPGDIDKADNTTIVDLLEAALIEQGVDQTVLDQDDVQTNLNTVASAIPNLPKPIGIDVQALPLVIPQAAIGLSIPMTPIKAEIVLRALPEIELEDVGKFKFTGLGGKLALDPFIPIPMFPLDVAIAAYFQKMTIGEIFESNHSTFNLLVGKNVNLIVFGFDVYGGIGIDNSNVKINYTYLNEDDPDDILNNTKIKFDLKGDNRFRATIGGRVRLAVLNVSADYSMGADNVATVGVGITLR